MTNSYQSVMKPAIKFIVSVIFSVLSCMQLHAQSTDNDSEAEYSNDSRGWIFGLNVGMYYVSKQTAAYYNGEAANENNVDFIMSNFYMYREIFDALGAHDSISVSGLPQNMHYKIAMQPGLYAQFCFNPTLALVLEFNYMQLKANDVITFDVDPPIDYLGNHDLRLYPMRGKEERVYMNIGLKKTYPKSDQLSWFLTGGLNVNSTKVKQCSFYVEGKEYSMVNVYGNNSYVPNNNMQTYNVYQGGIGIGMFAGAGSSIKFGNGIVLEPGLTAHWLMVKLNRYQNMNPGAGVYIRFLF